MINYDNTDFVGIYVYDNQQVSAAEIKLGSWKLYENYPTKRVSLINKVSSINFKIDELNKAYYEIGANNGMECDFVKLTT